MKLFIKLLQKFKVTPHRGVFTTIKADKELYGILKKEKQRQLCSLELIASENFTSTAVMQANSSILTNKYSEGYPGKRYYGGNEHIDELELLCQERALNAFSLDPEEWGVNVQSYSGSTANFAVYTGLLQPGQKIMGLDLPSGGHLTHGYKTSTKKLSNSSIYFDSMPYVVGDDYLIDFDELEKRADAFKPKLIIVGASAYPRDFDYARFKQIADKHGAYLMADIAHCSGLIASDLLNSPFKFCDVVTTTTHKTLRGPRAALIFYQRQYKHAIDFAVFPCSQGGPHNNTIAAVATALHQVSTDEFKRYSRQTIQNAQHLAKCLIARGFDVITNGTDNHIVLVNLKSKSLTGSKFEKLAEACNVSLNKNTVATDTSALSPTGIRLGTPAMTTRGFTPSDFEFVADVLLEICTLASDIQSECVSLKLAEFTMGKSRYSNRIAAIRKKVSCYCSKFPLPLPQ